MSPNSFSMIRWVALRTILVLGAASLYGCASTHPHPVPPLPAIYSDAGAMQVHYPDASRRFNEAGRTLVQFSPDSKGFVDARVVNSSGYPRLDAAALRIIVAPRGPQQAFPVSTTYQKSFLLSVAFEIQPCGQLKHFPRADYKLNVCVERRHRGDQAWISH